MRFVATVSYVLSTLALGVASNLAHSAIQTAWSRITKRTWEDLFYDSFRQAFNGMRPQLEQYTQDGEVKFNEAAFRKLLRQNLALNIGNSSLSETERDEFTHILADHMSRADVLIIGGHTLSDESYRQLVRNLIEQASAEFRIAVLKDEQAFRQAILAEVQGNYDVAREVQELLQNRFGIVIELLESIKDDTEATRDKVNDIHEWLIGQGGFSRFPVYAGIPSNPNPVKGQEAFVDNLVQRLTTDRSSALALEGLGGIGKTTLATALTKHADIQSYFSDGILWASLGLNPDVDRTLVTWLGALGQGTPTTVDTTQLARHIQNALGNRSVLFIIDDVWNINAARLLRCGGPNCRYLLTTRDRGVARAFVGEASRVISVPFLSDEVAYEWLQELAPEACETDPETAHSLAKAAGGLPLVIKLLGGYLGDPERSTFADLQKEALENMRSPQNLLQQAHQRLGNFNREETLKETILLSLEALPEEAVRAFHALRAFAPKPESFTREAAEVIAETDAKTLAKLISRNLVEKVEGERLSLHQVVSNSIGENERARLRHLNYYLDALEKNQRDWQAVEVFYGQARQAWAMAIRTKDTSATADLTNALAEYQMFQGLWSDALIWRTQALQLAEERKDYVSAGRLRISRALVCYRLGKSSIALEDLDIAIPLLEREEKVSAHLIHALNTRGMAHRSRDEVDMALADYQRAFKLAWRTKNVADLGRTLERYGALYIHLKQHPLSLFYSQYAVLLLGAAGDQEYMGSAIANMGVAYVNLSEFLKGIDCYNLSLQIREKIGDKQQQVVVLGNLGKLHVDHNAHIYSCKKIDCLKIAFEYLARARKIAEEMNDIRNLSNIFNTLGSMYKEAGQPEGVARSYCTALSLVRSVEDVKLEKAIRRNIAQFSADLSGTIEQLRIALKTSKTIQHTDSKDSKRQLEHYEELLALVRKCI